MAEQIEQTPRTDVSRVRAWMIRRPIATFLCSCTRRRRTRLRSQGFDRAGMLPGGATPHGVLVNVLRSAVPALSLPPW